MVRIEILYIKFREVREVIVSSPAVQKYEEEQFLLWTEFTILLQGRAVGRIRSLPNSDRVILYISSFHGSGVNIQDFPRGEIPFDVHEQMVGRDFRIRKNQRFHSYQNLWRNDVIIALYDVVIKE